MRLPAAFPPVAYRRSGRDAVGATDIVTHSRPRNISDH
jgi:hypothetical protein